MGTDPQKPDRDEYVDADDRVIGVAFRRSLIVIAVVAVAAVGYWFFNRPTETQEATVERDPIEAPDRLERSVSIPEVGWLDITESAGIAFRHNSGAQGQKFLPETMGAGAAFFDRDGDGDSDLLLIDSGRLPGETGDAGRSRLYDNDGSGGFRDVTAGAGIPRDFYGQGVAAADFDGDGDVDLFLAALGRNRLLRNDAGKFADVTRVAGVAGDADVWSSSAGFFDYDLDGDLDLFVCNYVAWSKQTDLQLNFTLNGTDRAYGPPNQYGGTHSYLYRNLGDGRFEDVSAAAGIQVQNPATGGAMGKALAVTFADVDGDRYPEIFVANDTVQNFLFRNRGDGTFEDIGAVSGLGFNSMGTATGAMGIDAGDFNNDGVLGVGIGNFANETTSFYVQQQRDPWQFVDVSNAKGIGSPSRLKLSFGLFLFDYDLDGRLDLLQANGHLEDEINEIQPSQQYRQPAQLFWNTGGEGRAQFVQVPEDRTGDLARPMVGRGAAYADIDLDGDLDVLLTQTGGAPLLARNDQQSGHNWLRVKLVDTGMNRDAIGAQVVLQAGGLRQQRQVMPTRSYLSQVEPELTFGLGTADAIDSLEVVWPDGGRQSVTVEAVNRAVVIRRDGA